MITTVPTTYVQFTPLSVTGVPGYAVTMDIESTARTTLAGVNAAGVAFGNYTDDTGTYGIVDNGGTIGVIAVPGSIDTQVTGVDATGNVSGTYQVSGEQTQSFIDSGGTITTIQIPGAINVTLTGTDAAGDLLGFYATDTSGAEYGFVDSSGTITTIAAPGSFQTHVAGIDAAGNIVGYTIDYAGNEEGFVDSNGSFTTIDVPGSYPGTTEVTGVDAAGDLVGTYVTGNYQTVGFIDSGGTFTTINGPGAFQTEVTGINAAGEAYGYYQTGNGVPQGFVYSGDTFTPIANAATVTGIDAAGDLVGSSDSPRGSSFIDSGGKSTSVQMPGVFQPHITSVYGAYIAGTYQDSSGEHDFIYNGQTLTTINVPGYFISGSPSQNVAAVNASGEVVGNFYDQSDSPTPFLYSGGIVTTIDVPGALSAEATGIDAAGDVVGTYADSNGVSHGFIDQNGTITTLDAPGASGTAIAGVDAAGDVFGSYITSSGYPGYTYGATEGYTQLFVESGGTFTNINPFTFEADYESSAYLTGVNAAGDAFGGLYTDVVTGAFEEPSLEVLDTQTFQGGLTYNGGLLNFLPNAYVGGIDGAGNAIGGYDNGGQPLGFVDAGGSFSSFSFPGETLNTIGAADTTNVAYGDYIDSNGIHHSFLLDLSPVAPTITGTKGSQITTYEAPIDPFTGVTIGDAVGAIDTLTITLAGPGTLADGAGFSNLNHPSSGTYELSGTAQAITSELDALVFTPVDGVPGTSVTTTFTLSDASNALATPAVDSATTVTDSDPAAPTITGTKGNQATTLETPLDPFSGVTIGDKNAGATDTLTITLGGPGTLADGAGFAGLSNPSAGTYVVSGTAQAITSELDALIFTPVDGVPDTSVTTTFTLSDKSSAFATPASDGTTTVIDSDPAVTPTINGTRSGQTTTSEASLNPFSGVTIGDKNAGATDTLTMTLNGPGTLADGAGFAGLSNPSAGTYVVSGTAQAITSELDALIFTPVDGVPDTSVTTTFTLSDKSSAFATPASDGTTTVIDSDPAVTPTINGTRSGQTTTSEASLNPFSGVTIGDKNAGATDTLTMTLNGPGTLADGAGFSGLSNPSAGTYVVSGTAQAITSELDALIFTPVDGVPDTSVTTTFSLSDKSSAFATPALDNSTTVTDHDAAVAPTIAGTAHGQTTTYEAPVDPFSGVTIGDSNSGATDTLTITLGGPGTLADGAGFGGLSNPSAGTYVVSGTAQAITSELDALVFTPVDGVPDTSVTTTFTLSDSSNAFATPTVDSTTTVIDSDPPHLAPPENFSGTGNSGALWRQSGSDALAEWSMDGAAITSSAAPTYQGVPVAPDASWTFVGTGDLGGNGKSDILWQSAAGGVEDWSMNGSQITASNWLTAQDRIVKPDSTWSMLGTGDFTGNGADDLLWRQSTTDTLAVWLMDGSSVTSGNAVTYQGSAVQPDATWSVAGLGDFNGDGSTDILWRQSTTGDLAEWQLNGSTITASAAVTYQGQAATPDSSWSVAGVGDFEGNGEADILWRQGTTDTLAMWLMNGSTIESSAAITYQGSVVKPDSTWNIVEIGDFNGGSDSDILWRQSTTGALMEWQMNGAQIVSSQEVTSQGAGVSPNSTWQPQAKPTDFA